MGLSTGPSRESPTETDLDEARFPGVGTVIGLTDGRKAIFLVHLVIVPAIVIIQRGGLPPPHASDGSTKAARDPVAPAGRQATAKAKVARRHHEDGTPIHSVPTRLVGLATMVRHTAMEPALPAARRTPGMP